MAKQPVSMAFVTTHLHVLRHVQMTMTAKTVMLANNNVSTTVVVVAAPALLPAKPTTIAKTALQAITSVKMAPATNHPPHAPQAVPKMSSVHTASLA
jgi:hypothetical protein